MQTNLADFIRDTPEGHEADAILRACVHCGFCTAVCPTYQLLGDDLDSPRGRIYLIKQMLEGKEVTAKTQLHLDRCLTCRACESACPSGVGYGRLVEIGRGIVEEKVAREFTAEFKRKALRSVLTRPGLFNPLLRLGRTLRPFLPRALSSKLPPAQHAAPWPGIRHARRMVVLDGCVQPALAPNINAAAARVLDRIGVSLTRATDAGCCGAVSYHTSAHEEGLVHMRRNVDAWWRELQSGAEAVVMSASGCGAMVKEYAHLLRRDPGYAEKAARVSAATRDLSEILAAEKEKLAPLLRNTARPARKTKIAFQSPCTLQHAQRIAGVVEDLLNLADFELTPVPDGHLCCGSAGTYSILQPDLSMRLRENKLRALESGNPQAIATANIGCLAHLQGGTDAPVKHWIEFLDEALGASA